jgi:quercetin dioxygenase-like cupin family protein
MVVVNSGTRRRLNMSACVLRLLSLATLLAFLAPAFAQTSAWPVLRLTPEELRWTPFPNGVFRADIAGDELKPGMYAYRVRFPSGFRNKPHFHRDDRLVIVISGTVYVGFSEEFSEGAMKPLPPGSIWTEPSREPHYVWVKDGEAVIQVVGGNGPSSSTPVKR